MGHPPQQFVFITLDEVAAADLRARRFEANTEPLRRVFTNFGVNLNKQARWLVMDPHVRKRLHPNSLVVGDLETSARTAFVDRLQGLPGVTRAGLVGPV